MPNSGVIETVRERFRKRSLIIDVVGRERAIVFSVVDVLVWTVLLSLTQTLARLIAAGHFLHDDRPTRVVFIVNRLYRLWQVGVRRAAASTRSARRCTHAHPRVVPPLAWGRPPEGTSAMIPALSAGFPRAYSFLL